MTALRRRHALMASIRDQLPADGRKTFKRHPHRQPHQMPDYRLCVLIPEPWTLRAPGAGAAGFPGITVEPDILTGPLAVASGKGLEWCMTQLGRFLLSIAAGDERIMTGALSREGVMRSQQIVVTDGLVEFPLGERSTLKVTA
jgi:hypothetical protein